MEVSPSDPWNRSLSGSCTKSGGILSFLHPKEKKKWFHYLFPCFFLSLNQFCFFQHWSYLPWDISGICGAILVLLVPTSISWVEILMQDCTGVHPAPGTGATGNGNWEHFSCNRHRVLLHQHGQTLRWAPSTITGDIPAPSAGQDFPGLVNNVTNQYQGKAPLTVPRAGSCSKQHNNYV